MNPEGIFSIEYGPPFNGRLALSGVIAAWLLPRLLKSPLMGKVVTEKELYDYIVEVEPRHHALFKLAGILTEPGTNES